MTWGIPTGTFLQIHVVLSLIGIASGLVALYGLLAGKLMRGWTALFLATTVLTSVTGFPLPPYGFDPPRAVGTLSLVLLAAAVAALYLFHLSGAWRWIYVATAVAAPLSQLLRRCRAVVPEAVVSPAAGADPVRAAVPGRAGGGAGRLRGARRRGGQAISSVAQGPADEAAAATSR
jgi:hypothetical protein